MSEGRPGASRWSGARGGAGAAARRRPRRRRPCDAVRWPRRRGLLRGATTADPRQTRQMSPQPTSSSTTPTPSSRTSASATGTATGGGQNGSVSPSRPRRSYAVPIAQREHRGRRRRASRSSYRGCRGAAFSAAAAAPWPPRAPARRARRRGLLRRAATVHPVPESTAVASNDLTQFYEAYPIQDGPLLRGGRDPAKGIRGGSNCRRRPVGPALGPGRPGYWREPRWRRAHRGRRRAAPGGGRTTPAATTTPAAAPRPPGLPITDPPALGAAWIVGRNLRDIGGGPLAVLSGAPRVRVEELARRRRRKDGCPNLRWVEGDPTPRHGSTARIAVGDTWGRLTVQNARPPLAPGEVRVYDSTPSAHVLRRSETMDAGQERVLVRRPGICRSSTTSTLI